MIGESVSWIGMLVMDGTVMTFSCGASFISSTSPDVFSISAFYVSSACFEGSSAAGDSSVFSGSSDSTLFVVWLFEEVSWTSGSSCFSF